MAPHIGAVCLLVRDYDQAIAGFTGKLGFVLIEDTQLGAGKRWVVVSSSGGEMRLLLVHSADVE